MAPERNPGRTQIKGTVCGVRVEESVEPLMREIRYLDRLMDAAQSVFECTEAESRGFSYARYFNQTGIESEWEELPLVKLGEKLMDEKRMRDFHRIVLDMDYRKELLEEVE